MTSPGLNSGAVLQNLQSVGSIQANYATENYVTQQITDKINQGYSLTIDIENAGVCIFTTSASSKTVVEIGISTALTDLSDVNITPTPPANSYLVYDGASWTAGSGVSKFSITDLDDFVSNGGALVPDAFLKVNQFGTSIVQELKDVISDVLPGNGIQVVTSGSRRTLNSNIASLPTAFGQQDSLNNFFAIEDSSGGTFRIKKGLIDLSGFQNSENYIKSSGISAYAIGNGSCPNMLIAASSGDTVAIKLNTDNLVTGVCGITSIEKGGTGSCTAQGARENLSLVYNEDIIKYNEGLFQETLTGDNILLINGIINGSSGFTISPGSSGFTDGTFVKSPIGYAGTNPPVEVTYVAAGGSVTNISGISPFDFFSPQNNTFELQSDSGSSNAFVTINFEDYSYLNFGVSRGKKGEHGLGFRYGLSDGVQFKESFDTKWRSLTNKFGMSGLTDVGSSTFLPAQILIYSGTCWLPQSITNATLTVGGSLSVVVTPEDIVTGLCPRITNSEFVGLSGFKSSIGTIQEQINSKIQVTGNLQQGDLIYYNNLSSTGVSLFSRVPDTGNQRFFLRKPSTSSGHPTYDDIYHGFVNKSATVSSGSTFCILNEGTCTAESYSLRNINRFLTGKIGTTGPSTGIDVNSTGVLTLNYNELNQISNIGPHNIISIGTSFSSGLCYVQQATIETFVSEITSSGISNDNGKLRLEIPFFGTSTEVPSPYKGQLVFFTNSISPGTSVLAVYDGKDWHGTTTSLVTF